MSEFVRIGAIEVDLSALEVRGSAGVCRLEPRAAAVLARLNEQPGRVVSRDELVRSVWHHPHVSKDTLAVTVHRLRQALTEAGAPRDGESPVQTVPRRGYRLVLPDEVTTGAEEFTATHWWLAAGGLAALVLLVIALLQTSPTIAPDSPAARLARAEALWERREPAAARRALTLANSVLSQAVDGPLATQAHALLGRFYGYKTAHWLGLKREKAAALGRSHLDSALAAAPDDPAVLTSAAGFALYTERDTLRAQQLAHRAVMLDPGSPATRQVYAKAAAAAGDRNTAVATIQTLASQVPTDGGVQWDRAFILFLAGLHQESLVALVSAEALTGSDLYWLEAFNLHAQDRHREAAAVWAGHLERHGCHASLADETATAFRELLEAEQACGEGFAYHRGLWAFYAGDLEQARRHFQAAEAEGDYMLIWGALSPLPLAVPALAGSS